MHSWLTAAAVAREAAAQAAAAIRTRGAVLDPVRACVGLADAAVARGAAVYERTEVRRIRAGRKGVEITTDGGAIRAETVIVAASTSIPDLRPLRRHFARATGTVW